VSRDSIFLPFAFCLLPSACRLVPFAFALTSPSPGATIMTSMLSRKLRSLFACLALVAAAGALADELAEFTDMRRALADAIEQGVNRARQRSGGPAIDPRVIAAIK
jgi:hypothetical protein